MRRILAMTVLLAASCGGEPPERVEVRTRLLHPEGTVDPYAGLDSVRIRVLQGGAVAGEETFAVTADFRVPADSVDPLQPIEVTVEGLAAGNVVRVGRSRSFVAGERAAGIFFAPPNAVSPAPSRPAEPRVLAGVTRLLDDRILLAGGTVTTSGSPALSSIEIYDPDTGTWSAGPSLLSARIEPGVVTLADGRVLIAGGRDAIGELASTEIVTPAADGTLSIAAGPSLPKPWVRPQAIPFGAGALLAGGWGASAPSPVIVDAAGASEIGGGVFAEGASLVALPDGRAVIVGGGDPATAGRVDVVATTGTLSAFPGVLRLGRYAPTAVSLGGTRVLVTGGADATRTRPTGSMEIVDVAADPPTSVFAPERDLHHRFLRPVVRLGDGRLFLGGGYGTGNANVTGKTLLVDPTTGRTEGSPALAPERTGRESAVAAADGTAFLAGSDQVSAVEIYVPGPGTPLARADVSITPRLAIRAAGSVTDGAASWRLRFWDVNSLVDERTGTGAPPAAISLPQYLTGNDRLRLTLEVLDGNGVVLAWGASSHASHIASMSLLVGRVDEFNLAPDAMTSVHSAGVAAAIGGRVVLAGGAGSGGAIDVWSPAGGETSAANGTIANRRDSRGVALDASRVLITGGRGGAGTPVATASIVTAVNDTRFELTTTGALGTAVDLHTLAVLSTTTDSVFVHGGVVGGLPIAFSQRWNGTTWTNAGTPTARGRHRATRLPDGRVLLAGGVINEGGVAVITTSAQIFLPASNTFVATGAMPTQRRDHEQLLLSDGDVLACGGIIMGTTVQTALCARWDFANGTWGPGGTLSEAKDDMTVVRRLDGMWMVVGGANAAGATTSVELVDPATGAISAGPALRSGRALSHAVVLRDGRVVVLGGQDAANVDLDSVEVWTPPAWTNPFGY